MTLTLAGLTIHEFDVAATDLLLCIEAWAFAWLLRVRPQLPAALRRLAIALFLALGASSLLGVVFHGWFPDKVATTGGYVVWMATGISIALTASIVWHLDAWLLDGRAGELIRKAVPAYFAAFVAVLFFVSYRFPTIIALYAPAVVVLALVALRDWLRRRERFSLFLVIGTGLSFVAGAVQVLKIGLHPQYFNFNALYHLIQGIAFAFLFAAFRAFSRPLSA